MRIYDISVTISAELPVYPGGAGVSIITTKSIAKGDHSNLTKLSLSSHTGTHIDAPRHFEPDGITVEGLNLNLLMGQAWVLELNSQQGIGRADLEVHDLKGKERLLLKTRNSSLWAQKEFQTDHVHLSKDGASYLVEMGTKLVGIDYLSVEKFESRDFPAHHTLLKAGVIILEGINLEGVEPGPYELICLPLKIRGVEGAPARAILVRREK